MMLMAASERHPPTTPVGGRQALVAALEARGHIAREDLAAASGLDQREVAEALRRLLADGAVVEDGPGWTLAPEPEPEPEPEAEHPRARVTVVRSFALPTWSERSDARVTRVEGDDLRPGDLRGAMTAALREAGVPREAKPDEADRQTRLAAFAEVHGPGEQARLAWNEANPSERYKNRRTFHRAVKRALDSPEQRVAALIREQVEEAASNGERFASVSITDCIAAAEGRQ
ncbi:MAG: hypothetical protein WD399_08085 [Thermoleophilaceae bacterium]